MLAKPAWAAAARQCDAAKPMAATRLVPYDHAAHHAQIQYICKDVYGGSDYLPDNLLQYSQDNQKVVRVLEAADDRDVLGIGEPAEPCERRERHSPACNDRGSCISRVVEAQGRCLRC